MNSVAVVLSMMAMMMLIDDDKDDGDAFLAILCYSDRARLVASPPR